MTHFDIVRVDPNDHALVQSWLSAKESVPNHDHRGLRPWNPMRPLTSLVVSTADRRREHWAAVCDGHVLGFLDLTLSDLDNTHLADFDVAVRPEARRRGVGSALLRHAEERAADEGRTTLSSWVSVPDSPDSPVTRTGADFAITKGFTMSLETAVRRCDLDEVDEAALDQLLEAAWKRAEGFELVPFEGAPPEELLDGMAYLHARMYTDMPLGEWDLQAADIDRGRLLDWSRQRRQRGELHLQVAVRHRESGDIAGFTEIIVEGGEEHHCYQGDTIVDPRFRGHRLGTILKVANQRRVREWRPKMRYVWTGNAVSNDHMISINEAVGYRPAGMEHVYQKKIA
jgi:GNAT superfamily N-acetyltransferase